MKQLLQTLTPAESLLLRKGDITPRQEMLKLTLLDLLLKRVLAIDTIENQSNARDPVRTYQYVLAGEKFRGYQALPHELTFMSDFQKSHDLRMLLRNCIKVAFQNAGSEKTIRKAVRSTPELADAFSDSWLGRLVGIFDYTRKGLALRKQLEDEIRQLEARIPKLLETNRDHALADLKTIGGNIFLLHGLGIKVLAEIEEAFLKNIPAHTSDSGCGGVTFSYYSSDFDSSCPADSSGDGGCSSGDGGGCGGCGGGD